MGMHSLPEAVLEPLTGFLLGVDLFRLSHTSSYALQVFSQDRFWLPRLKNRPSGGHSAKSTYMHQYSFVFSSSSNSEVSTGQDDSSVVFTWDRYHRFNIDWPVNKLVGAVSYDVWFSLASEEPGSAIGGVLMDLCGHHTAMVDKNGRLHCSVIEPLLSPIGRKLRFER